MNSLCVRAHVLCRLRSCAIALGGSNNAVAGVVYNHFVFSERRLFPPRSLARRPSTPAPLVATHGVRAGTRVYVTPVVSCAAGRHGRLVHGLAVRLSRRGAVLGRGCFQKCLTPQLPSPRCAACRSWRTARRSAYGKWQHERQRARQRRSGPTAAVGRRSIGTCVRHGDVTWTTLLPLLLRQRLARPVTLTLSAPTFSLPCLMSGVWHRARGGGARACRGARLALRPQGVADTSCQWAAPPRVLGTCGAHGPAVLWCSFHLFFC